jgi:hypothetical protein
MLDIQNTKYRVGDYYVLKDDLKIGLGPANHYITHMTLQKNTVGRVESITSGHILRSNEMFYHISFPLNENVRVTIIFSENDL